MKTYKDRIKELYPNYLSDLAAGGVVGCPDDYSVLNAPVPKYCNGGSYEKCAKCWNREIEKETEYEEI